MTSDRCTSSCTTPSTRRADVGDVCAVRQLVRQAYAVWVPLIGREPLPMGADYAHAVQAHDIDLLCVGEELVALIELIAADDHLYIENIAVVPEHQGRGFGRRLLRHAEERAGREGCSVLRLKTNAAFRANIRLYESVGFDIERREPFGDGFVVHMIKRIAATL